LLKSRSKTLNFYFSTFSRKLGFNEIENALTRPTSLPISGKPVFFHCIQSCRRIILLILIFAYAAITIILGKMFHYETCRKFVRYDFFNEYLKRMVASAQRIVDTGLEVS